MAWRNAFTLESKFGMGQFRERASELYSLSQFYEYALTGRDYKPSKELIDAVVITEEGNKFVEKARTEFTEAKPEDLTFAVFTSFYHHELWVDPEATDSETLFRILSDDVLGGNVRFPWIFGHVLYDRFYSLYAPYTETLSSDETDTLLDGTPAGVFQLRDILVGPFGAMSSLAYRWLPPTRNPMLWTCTDPSCGALHSTELTPHSPIAAQVKNWMEHEAAASEGPPSHWGSYLAKGFLQRDIYYDSLNPEKLPWLLANSFDEGESQLIVAKLLERHGATIRGRLPQKSRFKSLLTGEAAAIASRLNQSQALQISLLAEDAWIVSAIEELIDDEQIKIPPTEIRTPVVSRASNSWNNVSCECCRLGIRFDPSTYASELPRLRSLIAQLYEHQSERDALDFRLRHISGNSLNERLEKYLYTTQPRDIVTSLIFVSQHHIQRSFEILKYGQFVPPANEEEEKALADRILWKLGFNLPMFPSFQSTFWNRLERFLQTSRTFRPYSDLDEESIRSAGINLFVSLEEVLDYSLAFSAWALLADHYGTTGWRFNLEESRAFMVEKLNGLPIGGPRNLELDARGRNGLFALIEGFQVLAGMCEGLVANPAQYRRPTESYPGFVGKSNVERFPFLHTALLLDVAEADRDRLLSLLRDTTRELNLVDVPNMRNRLGHNRDDFPTQQEIETACGQLTETISKLEESGLLPTVRLRYKSSFDDFGRGNVVLRDFRGAELHVSVPSQLAACQLPRYTGWIVVVPGMHIGDSAEIARFRFIEPSSFRVLWKEFPKQRADSIGTLTQSPLESPAVISSEEAPESPGVGTLEL